MAEKDVPTILDEAGVEYELLPHPRTETAAAEAEVLGIDPKDVAKTLVVSSPGGYVRAVLPATERLDLHKLRERIEGGKRIHLATEEDLERDYCGSLTANPGTSRRPLPGLMELTSSAFGNGEPIPRRHTCEGDDLSPRLT